MTLKLTRDDKRFIKKVLDSGGRYSVGASRDVKGHRAALNKGYLDERYSRSKVVAYQLTSQVVTAYRDSL